jgi:hypothetical protein
MPNGGGSSPSPNTNSSSSLVPGVSAGAIRCARTATVIVGAICSVVALVLCAMAVFSESWWCFKIFLLF